MTMEEEDGVLSLEELKSTVKTSFTKIYAALKARELQTLRQLDVILCQNSTKKTNYRCAQINISYENESTLLAEIRKYGLIDFKKLKIDEEIYITEDYVLPDDDHMYSYKCIEEDCRNIDSGDVNKEIEFVALKQITSDENCTCFVNVSMDDKCSDTTSAASFNIGIDNFKCKESTNNLNFDTIVTNHNGIEMDNEEKKSSNCAQNESQSKSSNLSPTQEWLDYIKDQTETEPTHVSESMEHSAIACTP